MLKLWGFECAEMTLGDPDQVMESFTEAAVLFNEEICKTIELVHLNKTKLYNALWLY